MDYQDIKKLCTCLENINENLSFLNDHLDNIENNLQSLNDIMTKKYER